LALDQSERIHDIRTTGLHEQRLSVLITDIVDSTRLASRLGSERFGELLTRFYQRVLEIVAETHGEPGGHSGDGVQAVFGRQAGQIQHEARAVRAGLEILASVDQLSYELKEQIIVGVGIETGTVIAGYVDTSQQMKLAVLGETVHIAEKLESIARPNRLLIGPTTYSEIMELFATRQLGSIRLDDRSVKVDIFEVLRATTQAR
jgi:adenylate cyclase